jgi:methylglutaconyl-CoA hydratase
VRIGVVPAIISVLCLRRMSPADAHRFLLTGEQFDPAQARAAGLIVDVVADGELDTTIDALLGQFRLCQPEALRQTRELLHTIPQMDVDAGFARAHAVSQAAFASPQAAEGIAAFREKRPPSWAQDRA